MFDPSPTEAAHCLLSTCIDEDWHGNPHLQRTPERFAEMLQALTTPEPFSFTTFGSDHDQMVIVKDIPFYTFCAHHVLPFHGKAHVAYIPDGKICGISKLARTVEYYSRGLNVQEDLTDKVASFIQDNLNPLGIGVVMEAEHLCMTMRGVEAAGTLTVTSAMRGVFLDTAKGARSEFLSLVRK